MTFSTLVVSWIFTWTLLVNTDLDGSTDTDTGTDTKPNIIFFLIDDWGFNDVGYYGNTDTDTTFINKLVREESLRIDKYYVMPECTATRCALLTGRYPMRYGLQDGILYYQSPYALSGQEYLLSKEFQGQGYKTHLVGKWHLGMMASEYTPTYRGFDSFVGFYAGLIYYYSHYGIEDSYPDKVDFHMDTDGWHEDGKYSMYTYQDRILTIIDEAAEDGGEQGQEQEPFFLYVGWQGSHYPSEAPDEYADKYDGDDKERARQYFQAQTTLTDELLEGIVAHLKATGVWDNTLLVVSSDNGADWGYGDNSPLRGSKFTLWEGGIRVPAFISGGFLPAGRRGQVLSDIPVHVTDWYPTLLSAAGLERNSPNELDGMNLWKFLENEDSHRVDEVLTDRVILLNADSYGCGVDVCGAVLYGGRWKLVTGTNQLVSWESGSAELDTCFWHRAFGVDEENDFLECGTVPETLVTDSCACTKALCLFDLESDPCEYYNVYEDNIEIGTMLAEQLQRYYDEQSMVLFETLFNVATVIAANGEHGGYWEPWADKTDGFTTWDELLFEQLLLPYYGSENVEKELDRGMSALWIGLIVAGLGLIILGVFLIWRLRCARQRNLFHSRRRGEDNSARMQRDKRFKGDNVDMNATSAEKTGDNADGSSVYLPACDKERNEDSGRGERRGIEEEEERMPLLTQHQMGNGNSYSTNGTPNVGVMGS